MAFVTDSGKVISTMEHNKFVRRAKKAAKRRGVGKHMSSSAKLKMVKSRAKNAKMGVNRKGIKLSVLKVKKGNSTVARKAIQPITTMKCKGKKK